MNILKIYDNSGVSYDRYTVYFDELWSGDLNMCLAMSEDPFHPLGFCQHSGGQLGDHNGKEITFDQLPADCQKVCKQEMQ